MRLSRKLGRNLGRKPISSAARAALAMLLSLAVTGCALMHRRPEAWALPAVGTGPAPVRWVQSLTLAHQGKSMDLMAVIESDGKTFTLVGLSPMGQRLVRITWTDGKVDQESDANIPVPIDGEAILRDVVFVNWPEAALQTVFAGSHWKAGFQGANRTLSWKGRPWLSVRPDGAAGAEGKPGVVVDHLVEGYQVHVKTVEEDAP